MTAPSLQVVIQGTGVVSADNLNTYGQTCDNVAELRAFVGAPGVQVYIRGFNSLNDGGQGEFAWNPSGTGPDDGGITSVVPYSAASGCWTRLNYKTGSGLFFITNATGTNAVTLTPLSNQQAIYAYANGQVFGFVPANTSIGNVTAAVVDAESASLAFLPVYLPNGTQAGSGALTVGFFAALAYDSALNSGAGGFYLISPLATSGANPDITPQGRLTLSAGTPVMTADVTGATSVFYVPYNGSLVPIWTGAAWADTTFTSLSVSLSGTSANGVYDIFVFLNSGVAAICLGPAWSTAIARGTGAGTTQIAQTNGLWVNSFQIAGTNGSSSFTVPAAQATYVGTVAITTTAGQTSMQFKPSAAAGGTGNFLGLWNAYGRVTYTAFCRDNTASWTPAGSWGAMDASNSNSISFVDGLAQSTVNCYLGMQAKASTNVADLQTIGVVLDSRTATPEVAAQLNGNGTVALIGMVSVSDFFGPQIGRHYVQAMEIGNNSTGYGVDEGAVGVQVMQLQVKMDM